MKESDPVLDAIVKRGIEAQRAREIPATPGTYEDYCQIFGLADIPALTRVLDVGAGVSNFTARLLSQGVDAHALDPKFDHNSPQDILEQAKRFAEDLGETDEKLENTLEEFSQSFSKYRDRYIKGYLSHMPCRSNSFDLAISSQLVFKHFADDLLLPSLQELIRVVRPGGQVKIYPIPKTTGSVEANLRHTLDRFKKIDSPSPSEEQKDKIVDLGTKANLYGALLTLKRKGLIEKPVFKPSGFIEDKEYVLEMTKKRSG